MYFVYTAGRPRTHPRLSGRRAVELRAPVSDSPHVPNKVPYKGLLEQVQHDLTIARSRDALVRSRPVDICNDALPLRGK